MSATAFAQLIALTAGALLLSGVLLVWRRSLTASLRLLSLQGVALGALAGVVALHRADAALLVLAVVVAVLKGGVLPTVIGRSVDLTRRESGPAVNPTAQLIAATALTMLAFVVARPLTGTTPDPATRAVPVGIALLLIGFQLLLTRRLAISQLVGFLVLDNGIATVAFLTAGGVPLVVELGVSLDVLLVVLILHVFAGRMRQHFGGVDLDELRELHD